MSSNNAVHVAMELSSSTGLIAARLPGTEKSRLHRVEGGDSAALLALLAELGQQASTRLGHAVEVVCCFEAGRDGFWLHRLLTAHGIAAHVLEPTSILVNRRARRAKTDRLDAEGMLRVLAAWLSGDRQVCSMVRVLTVEDEDAKRPHREREHLVQEKLRVENRIDALLFTQGIRGRPPLRSWKRDMAELRTGDGRTLPPLLRTELDRLHRRLVLALEPIRELEAERAAALAASAEAAAADNAMALKITALQRIRGIGENFSAVLVREVLYRSFANRRQIGKLCRHRAYALPEWRYGPRPEHQSRGQPARPDNADPTRLALVALPAPQRAGRLVPRARRHVARPHAADRHRGHGRKLLIGLWRYVETGVLPDSIEIRPQAAAAA